MTPSMLLASAVMEALSSPKTTRRLDYADQGWIGALEDTPSGRELLRLANAGMDCRENHAIATVTTTERGYQTGGNAPPATPPGEPTR